MIVKSFVLGALVVCFAGCAVQSVSPPGQAVASDVPSSGRMRGYVAARRHGDFVFIDGKEQRREIEYGWDYDRGVALRKTFDASGKLLETQEITAANLVLTKVEIERVRQLVRGQPQLKPIVDQPDVVIWAGGFAFRKPGDMYCDRGSRCIHAIAAADHGDTAVAHAIVDLQSDRVVYPFFKPSDGESLGKIHGE